MSTDVGVTREAKYPRIGPRNQPKGRPCVVCRVAITTGKVVVQMSHMRGDDEVEPCCASCLKLPDKVLLSLIQNAWAEKATTEQERKQ